MCNVTIMDPQELVPLEEGIPRPPRPSIATPRNCYLASRSCYRVPLRLCRLMAMLIILPCLFIFVPLYLRYRVFSGQMYPMSMTDMRLIDSKISTTWCQRQVVRSNATFNAFVVPGPPELAQELVPVSMTRELELGDDMKEYWGFYLLKGSSVTVSTCVKHPGASLIMIKGYKHLQDCAYIGDDSSEEEDELLEANRLGLISDNILVEKLQILAKSKGQPNSPGAMRRQKAGVSFHDPDKATNITDKKGTMETADGEVEHDPKELREILERLHSFRLPSNIESLPSKYRHRDPNVDKDERPFISFQDLDGNNSLMDKQVENPIKSSKTSTQKPEIEDKLPNTNTISDEKAKIEEIKSVPEVKNGLEVEKEVKREDNEERVTEIEGDLKEKVIVPRKGVVLTTSIGEEMIKIKEVTTKYSTEIPRLDLDEASSKDSKEVFEDVLQRLQALGERGKRVLKKLHQTMGVEYSVKTPPSTVKSDIMSSIVGSEEELDRLRKVLVEAIDEEKTKSQRKQRRKETFIEARAKREYMQSHIELKKSFNEDDEARDFAAEEDLAPDGYAEDHNRVNETTANDMSNSEFWSSFSSSEEALLECEGLILNLPLTSHSSCSKNVSEHLSEAAAKANALTYTVPANGYYFFVFSSENEVNVNFIRARFDLQKTRYDVARTTLRECTNSTERCDLPLDIFTSQKVVLEVPLRNNDSLWNEQFVIISECEPRTSIYVFCVIAVPILIMIFAFQ